MKSKVSVALYLLGITITAATTVPQFRYGRWLDPDAFVSIGGIAVPYGAAVLMMLLHWAKVVFVVAIVMLWRRTHYTAALVVAAICFSLAALSAGNSTSLLALNRIERVTSTNTIVQRDADLRAELKALGDRLALVGWRPLAAVSAEIAAERRQYAWESTLGCTQTKTGADRRYCARLERLDGELGVAREAERLRFREAEVRQALAQQPMATRGRQHDLDLLADVLGLASGRADLLRSIVWCLAVEIVEIALFWVAGLLSSAPSSFGREQFALAANRSEKKPNAKRAQEARRRSVADAGDPAPSRPAAADRIAEPGSAAAMASARPLPPIVHTAGECDACPYAQRSRHRAASVVNMDERRLAVAAFVAQLPRSSSARTAGSALLAAYDRRRAENGWPLIPPNIFGTLVKPAIEAVGGQKRKSNKQMYVGVVLPSV